jgi:hypothetical protein
MSDIVNQLGRLPLAVAMSGIYFKNTEGQLSEPAAQYFSDLAAVIAHASRSVEPGQDCHGAMTISLRARRRCRVLHCERICERNAAQRP